MERSLRNCEEFLLQNQSSLSQERLFKAHQGPDVCYVLLKCLFEKCDFPHLLMRPSYVHVTLFSDVKWKMSACCDICCSKSDIENFQKSKCVSLTVKLVYHYCTLKSLSWGCSFFNLQCLIFFQSSWGSNSQ